MTAESLTTLWTDWDPRSAPKAPLRRKEAARFNVIGDLWNPAVTDQWRGQTLGMMALCGAYGHIFRLTTDLPKAACRYFSLEDGEKAKCDIINALAAMAHAEMDRPNYRSWLVSDIRDAMHWIAPQHPFKARWPLPNVWMGAIASTAAEVFAAGNLDHVPAALRFLYLRPTEAVCLRETFGLYEPDDGVWYTKVGSRWAGSPDWVIVSAPEGGSLDVRWVETIIAQCRGADVPVWVDSLGPKPLRSPEHDGATGFFLPVKHPTGSDMSEWPEALRVRQMPEVRHA